MASAGFSSLGGRSKRGNNEAVKFQGFVQTRLFLCPDEALTKSERLSLNLNLQKKWLPPFNCV